MVADPLDALRAIAHGQAPAAAGKGPRPSNALSGNFLAGGSAPMVYWGQSNVIHSNTSGRDSSSQEEGDQRLGITQNRSVDSTMTLQGAVQDWYKWSEAEHASFAKRLYNLGLLSDPSDIYGQQGAFAQWQNAVQLASNYYTATNGAKKVTPWQAVDIMGGLSTGGLKETTHTQTSKSFNIPTVEDAHAATKQLFQALMGRGPDENELNRYASMMTAYAQKHPSINKTTQTTDIHGNSTSSSTSSGGYSQAGLTDMLGSQAKQDPEYGAYQAATTYWNALVGALGGLGGAAPNA